jgi:hypothetical protein
MAAVTGRCDTDDATLTLNSRMRIVALSDQHGFLPDVPPCDLLIVAGDVCPDRFGPFIAVHDPYQQQAWFDRTVRPWLAATTSAIGSETGAFSGSRQARFR